MTSSPPAAGDEDATSDATTPTPTELQRLRAIDRAAQAFNRDFPPDHRIHAGSPAILGLRAAYQMPRGDHAQEEHSEAAAEAQQARRRAMTDDLPVDVARACAAVARMDETAQERLLRWADEDATAQRHEQELRWALQAEEDAEEVDNVACL